MAIYGEVPDIYRASDDAVEAAIDVEAWTEEATRALASVNISTAPQPTIRGTSVTLDIPLDDHVLPQPETTEATASKFVHSAYTRRKEPLRRDSLKRREALLKGKEGSRQRRRWENDRLWNNPHAQPPLPSDWEIRPTYPVHTVPYYLAPLWDAQLAPKSLNKNQKANKPAVSREEEEAAKALKQLRERLRQKRAAKHLLEDIEQEVRKFIENWEEKERRDEQDGLADLDSDDEEIVFVGRNGQMNDMRAAEQALQRDKMVFDSLVGDRSGAFGRWLVHSIATYYNLDTWSITTGNPAKREAYIAIKEGKLKSGHQARARRPLPQPLWSMV
ncbi:R3H-associated N-terminal domain-containing protein [Phyllosticta citrichinensis]|uniref:R3H-associated N-terminal domain-containing protein n=1 Tax=Phyllosticta citrichinensis TaxID=1130410 RepID=A0ABR1Y548_9PEZI